MARPTCDSCAAYNPLGTGECRRHAPTILPAQGAVPGQIQIHSVWPPTKGGNWCCDFIAVFPGELVIKA